MKSDLRVLVAGAPSSVLTARTMDRLPQAILIYEPLTADVVASVKPDLLVSAAHQHYIRAAVRDIPALGAVGLHPALLPRYRGSYPLWWALRNRETETGLSLYHLVKVVDAGPIIEQRRVPILRGDTFASLYERVGAEVAPMLDNLFTYIAMHDSLPPGEPQDSVQSHRVQDPAAVAAGGDEGAVGAAINDHE